MLPVSIEAVPGDYCKYLRPILLLIIFNVSTFYLDDIFLGLDEVLVTYYVGTFEFNTVTAVILRCFACNDSAIETFKIKPSIFIAKEPAFVFFVEATY